MDCCGHATSGPYLEYCRRRSEKNHYCLLRGLMDCFRRRYQRNLQGPGPSLIVKPGKDECPLSWRESILSGPKDASICPVHSISHIQTSPKLVIWLHSYDCDWNLITPYFVIPGTFLNYCYVFFFRRQIWSELPNGGVVPIKRPWLDYNSSVILRPRVLMMLP